VLWGYPTPPSTPPSDTTTNIIDEGDGKVTNTAKKNAMAITNSAINGKMPQ